MKKFMPSFIVIMLIFISLVITKPSKEDFKNWANNQYNEKKSKNLKGLIIKKSLQLQLNFNIIYEDKIVYSIIASKVNGKEVKYIGVFGNWFTLSN
jgi:hypothetical protein